MEVIADSKYQRERNTRLPAKFYNENATELAQQYLSTSFGQVDQSWSQFLPAIMVNPQRMRLNLFEKVWVSDSFIWVSDSFIVFV